MLPDSVEADITELIGAAQESASLLMQRHRGVLRRLATELAQAETLNATDLRRILGDLVAQERPATALIEETAEAGPAPAGRWPPVSVAR